MSTILKELNEIQILQVVKQQYCNCLIALSGYSRSQTWNWFTAKHSPREETEGFISPLSVCHITIRKIILGFQWVNNSHTLAWH